ncbi:MAG: hypothetical protein G01um101456_514 [Parcubacteria group bacterium Gr01-1014_56]|nr:MAG: hypothetical protein G01um101456_514 [Parcubacteria group bacterium Gr01-1014_56]
MTTPLRFSVLLVLAAVLGLFGVVSFASANHSWGGYHWARTANPFTLKLGDNVTSKWDSYLAVASTDWSVSNILDTTIVAGNGSRNCRPTAGRAEICSKSYGNNGWLGIASIWISGGHITQGTVKMNDTYFNTVTYNTPAWRQFVMCQEVGHIFGLDHQDIDFYNANLGTCMDYTSNPGTNQHPNQHDYDQLETIYAHLDSITTLAKTSSTGTNRVQADDSDLTNEREWGRETRRSTDGRSSVYERDLGQGDKILTHVFWAEPRNDHARN